LNEIIKRRRPWLAALLSFLVIGLGQLYCGRPARGALFFGLSVLIALAIPVAARIDLQVHGQPSWIAVLFATSFAIQLSAAVDAWRLARRIGTLQLHWYNKRYVYLPLLILIGVGGTVWSLQLYKSFSVPSVAMAPTFLPGDRFILLKTAYDNWAPQPGDIIIVSKGGTFYVKRMIGVAGDRIQMKEGRLVINGVQVERKEEGQFTVGENRRKLYRETLSTGRSYEIVEQSDTEFLDNTPEIVVPPGMVFLMGDNRDNSKDSRVPSFGPTSVEQVVGRAAFVYWSKDLSRVGANLE
jgi:signal peptidase I